MFLYNRLFGILKYVTVFALFLQVFGSLSLKAGNNCYDSNNYYSNSYSNNYSYSTNRIVTSNSPRQISNGTYNTPITLYINKESVTDKKHDGILWNSFLGTNIVYVRIEYQLFKPAR
jgi:hypothetical protein